MTGYVVPELTADERELLDIIELTAGCSIWRRRPELSDADPVGGIVIRAAEDGQSFRVVDWRQGRPVFRSVALDEIDPASVALPNAAYVRTTARRLMAAAGAKKGITAGEELELVGDAYDLLRSIV